MMNNTMTDAQRTARLAAVMTEIAFYTDVFFETKSELERICANETLANLWAERDMLRSAHLTR